MASVSIHYTSASEGLTLGVHGDDWLDCLLKLEEEFGEGVTVLYAKTRDEMKQTFAAVAETFTEELNDAKQSQQQERAATAAELDLDPDDGEGTGDTPDADGASGSGDASPDPDTPCSICGAGVTEDFAEASTIMVGEVRCPDCIP